MNVFIHYIVNIVPSFLAQVKIDRIKDSFCQKDAQISGELPAFSAIKAAGRLTRRRAGLFIVEQPFQRVGL